MAVQQPFEGASKFRVEDVIDNGVDESVAVGQPLKRHQHLWRDIRAAMQASGVDRVRQEEGQVENHKHEEQYPQYLHGTFAFVRTGLTARPACGVPLEAERADLDLFAVCVVDLDLGVEVLHGDIRTRGARGHALAIGQRPLYT